MNTNATMTYQLQQAYVWYWRWESDFWQAFMCLSEL